MKNIDNQRVKFLIHWLIQEGRAENQEDLGRKMGIKSKSYLSQLVSGKVNNIDFINKLTKLDKRINIEWIKTGEGEMLKSLSLEVAAPRSRHIIRYWTDVDATAGGVQLFDDIKTNSYIDIAIPEFRDCTDAVNLYGDSMLPIYKSGQIIILKKWMENFIDFGNVYLIITRSGNRMVKYLRKSTIRDKILCTSENKEFDPFEIDITDILELYIVKGSISKNGL